MFCAVSRFKPDWMKSSESKYCSVSWLCEESQWTVKAKVRGNAERNRDSFIHTARARAAPSLAALECGSARAEGLENKGETSSNPTHQGLCFVMPDLYCFMQNSDGRRWPWSVSLCHRNLTQVYKKKSAFKGNRLWRKVASVFPVRSGKPGLGIRSFPAVRDALEKPSVEPAQGGSAPEILLHSVLPRFVISTGVSEWLQ